MGTSSWNAKHVKSMPTGSDNVRMNKARDCIHKIKATPRKRRQRLANLVFTLMSKVELVSHLNVIFTAIW